MLDMNALFRATAHVKLFKRPTRPHRFDEEYVAVGVVGQDSTLEIAGVPDGRYWAVVSGGPPIAVTAKGGNVVREPERKAKKRSRPSIDGDVMGGVPEGRGAADTLVEGDPKVHEAPAATRDVVTGPRTSANTRVRAKADVGSRVKPSLRDKVKSAGRKARK